MKISLSTALTLVILLCSRISLAAPAKGLCDDAAKTHKLEASTTGEVIEGPACVQVKINAVRYSAALVKTITFTAGPNLSSVFPKVGEPTGERGPAVTAAAPVTLQQAFDQIWNRVNGKSPQGISDEFYSGRQAQNRRFSDQVDKFLAQLKNTVIQSDEILATGSSAAVLNLVKNANFQSELQDVILIATDSWRSSDDILVKIHGAQKDLAALPQTFARPVAGPAAPNSCDAAAWQEWFTQCGGESRYKLLQDQLAKLEADALQMASGSDEAQKIAKKAGLLKYWQNVISGLDEKAFQVQAEAGCGVLFNRNKQTAIKLVLTDRVVLFDGQTPAQQVKDPLVTVECASPFSISAGVGFSTIEDREFSLVKSAPPPGQPNSVLRFGESTRSPVHPMPLAMAHARVYDWDSDKYALHASFGVAAAIKGQNAGGSNAEYLTGLSLSFFRTIYLTGGLHIGQQAKLAGGFNVGDIVPPDITEPPVQKGYKVGFGFAVTFTKP
jgi:hypothetical protein